MVSGGVITPPKTYFEKIQAVLAKYDILLVADEVICGFGRTGNMFGSQTYGMRPDMIVVAKQLSAGYLPISALMVSDGIYRGLVSESEKIGTFGHGFTYSGHPVCAAVALETLRIYEEDGILEHVRSVTPHFQARVAELGKHPLVGEARGAGLLAAVELVANKETREPFPPSEAVAAHAGACALNHGVITRALGDAFNFCPPLIITHDQIDELFDASEKALDDTLAWRNSLANR
jgi:4-aminobutyrate--pyruvate transaminase